MTKDIAPKWEPLETAPDSTLMLVFVPNYGITVAIQTKYSTGAHWWMRDSNEYCYPSHWMPLPSPPQKEQNPNG